MKLYIHYEDEKNPELSFSLPITVNDPDLTFEPLMKIFFENYAKKFPQNKSLIQNKEKMALFSDSSCQINLKKVVYNVASDLDDFFIKCLAPQKIEPSSSQIPVEQSIQSPNLQPISKSSPKTTDSDNSPTSFLTLGEYHISKGNLGMAFSVYENAISQNLKNPVFFYRAGDILLNAKKYDQALKMFTMGSEIYPEEVAFWLKLADIYLEEKDYKKSLAALQAAQKAKNVDPDSNKKISLGLLVSNYWLGNKQSASTGLRDLIRKDEKNYQALYHSATFLIDQGQKKDALLLLLHTISSNPDFTPGKKVFSELFKTKQDTEMLFETIDLSESTVAPLMFLAGVLKEFGKLVPVETIYEKVMKLQPNEPSHVLAFVHLIELEQRYSECFEISRQFIKRVKDLKIGSFCLGDISYLLEQVPTFQKISGFEFKLPKIPLAVSGRPEKYSQKELDVLALLFTVVKVCFIGGAMEIVPPLVRYVQPLRDGKDLHLTPIRNENAYFGCISDLLEIKDFPLTANSSSAAELKNQPAPIYVCGDSHSLVPASRQITVRGQTHRLVTRLVTGLKIWHMRPETQFYPKLNFLNAIESIPKGSNVVFIFGEIDCREGVLKAVAKYIYKDLTEACTFLINLYLQILHELQKAKNFKIFVHPPPPVLDVTRKTVLLFTNLLKEKMKNCEFASYMDFSSQLLDPVDLNLKKEYLLDGTHLHPSYLSLWEPWLENLRE